MPTEIDKNGISAQEQLREKKIPNKIAKPACQMESR
jgi:hypothetical protein